MSQRCPTCRTKLWNGGVWLWNRSIRCPRCGIDFRPRVPWEHFRVLLVVAILLGLAVIFLLERPLLLLATLISLPFVLWLLPKLIELDPTAIDITAAEGPSDPQQLHLELGQEEGKEQDDWPIPKAARKWLMIFLAFVFLVLVNSALRTIF